MLRPPCTYPVPNHDAPRAACCRPYLGRDAETADKANYQTVYARSAGSVAAPTAGLHFTSELLQALVAAGAKISNVNLHVGAGTFQPVTAPDIAQHDMHAEQYVFPTGDMHTR